MRKKVFMKLNLTIKLPWAKFRRFTTIDWHNYSKCHFNSCFVAQLLNMLYWRDCFLLISSRFLPIFCRFLAKFWFIALFWMKPSEYLINNLIVCFASGLLLFCCLFNLIFNSRRTYPEWFWNCSHQIHSELFRN